MPGVNLLVKKNHTNPEFSFPGSTKIFEDADIVISKNIPYLNYPVTHWENDQFVFLVEGYFYEWIDYKVKIERFAESYFHATDKDLHLEKYFSDTDAEFVIILHHKGLRSTIIFNDILGRFPFYSSGSRDYLLLSRNVSFIEHFHGLVSSPTALLETLTFGFTLGAKTLYEGVERVQGGSIIEISNGTIKKRRYHSFDYEGLIDENVNPGHLLEEITTLFVEAVKSRSLFADLNIVALSGGLDSRAVAGAFLVSGLPYELISFLDKERQAQSDVLIANRIAERHNLPLTRVDLPDPDVADFELMFKLKYGLNALDMTLLVNFYKYLVSLSEFPAHFTGDGGDKVFPDIRPNVLIKSPQSIVNYAVYSNAKMNPGVAARILRSDKNYIFEEVATLMNSYPERDWDQKYIHFLMDNRVSNWLTEGEDRSRCFLQSFTPFYHIRVFKKLMSVPPYLKKDFALYDQFLKIISPGTYDIPNANWGFTTTHRNKVRWIYLKQQLKNTKVGTSIKDGMRKKDNYISRQTLFEKEIFSKLISLSAVRDNIDIDLIRDLKHFNQDNFLHVLTLMKIISIETTGRVH